VGEQPSPPTPSTSSASEAEVVERGVSPVANLPPNTASAGAEAPAAVIFSGRRPFGGNPLAALGSEDSKASVPARKHW